MTENDGLFFYLWEEDLIKPLSTAQTHQPNGALNVWIVQSHAEGVMKNGGIKFKDFTNGGGGRNWFCNL